MDDQKFLQEKRRILNEPANFKVLQGVRGKVDEAMNRPGQATQIPFSFAEQPRACAEFGWPNDEAHHERVIELIKAYLQNLGWKWRIRNIIEANLLSEHHGIGSRIDDYKGCKQYSGIIMKQYEAVLAKGDKDAKIAKDAAKGKVMELPKDKEKKPEKEKKKGGLFGGKKDKKEKGSEKKGAEKKKGKADDDEDDDAKYDL